MIVLERCELRRNTPICRLYGFCKTCQLSYARGGSYGAEGIHVVEARGGLRRLNSGRIDNIGRGQNATPQRKPLHENQSWLGLRERMPFRLSVFNRVVAQCADWAAAPK